MRNMEYTYLRFIKIGTILEGYSGLIVENCIVSVENNGIHIIFFNWVINSQLLQKLISNVGTTYVNLQSQLDDKVYITHN